MAFDSSIISALQGPTGTAAGFGTPTKSVSNVDVDGSGNAGTATLTITATGADTAKVFNFAFGIPVGATGATGSIDLTADNEWTGIQRVAFEGTVNPNGVFDLSTGHNFKCTPAASATITLTFTGESSGSLSPHNGQSGYIYLTNDGSVTVQGDTTTHHDGTILDTLSGSTAAKYLISYICDGTNVFITNSAAIAAGVS